MTYMFHRGETLSVALDCVSGDAAGVSAVTAAMKPLAAGRTAPDPAALAVPLTVTARAGGWTATLAAAACAALAPGSYALDARLKRRRRCHHNRCGDSAHRRARRRMSTLILRWRRVPPPVAVRWAGPDVSLTAAPDAVPPTPIAAIVGPPGVPGGLPPGSTRSASSGTGDAGKLVALGPDGRLDADDAAAAHRRRADRRATRRHGQRGVHGLGARDPRRWLGGGAGVRPRPGRVYLAQLRRVERLFPAQWRGAAVGEPRRRVSCPAAGCA